MHAIAKMTTSVALVSVRPPASSANGSTTMASAAVITAERRTFIRSAGCARRTARAAGSAARAASAGTSTPRRLPGQKYTVRPRTTPTISAANTTPQNEPSPPITTTTNEAVRISAPIAGCTPVIGASSTPASAASRDADRDDGAHVRLQRNAERGHHVRVLHARAHDAAERRALQQEPQSCDRRGRDREHDQPVLRVDEVADQAAGPCSAGGNRERQRRRAEDQAQRLLGDHREPEGEQQAERRILAIEAPEQEALDDEADQRDQHRRDDERRRRSRECPRA